MEKWETWPPEQHIKRLERYKINRLLFCGKHEEVFARVQSWLEDERDKSLVYIVANFAGLISKVMADLLFGEPVRITTGAEGSPEQLAMNDIVENNNLHTTNYEMAISSSWRGDAVYKTRFGKLAEWAGDNHVIVESVPSSIFFPHLNSDNVRDMAGATLAWIKKQGEREYLRKEIHLPGKILNELWLVERGEIKRQVPLSTFEEYADLEEEQETGYEGLLLEYVPNWRLDDDFYGISDYDDLASLFDELNNRISKISQILDKHSDPKLVLPTGLMEYDQYTQSYYVRKETLQCIELEDGQGANLPRYLVWDAQLDAAFRQIDKLLDFLMMMAEISPAAFGMDKGGVAESGRALKFRLLRTLAKVNRKKLYFDQGLKNILYAAQVLDVVHGGKNYTPTMPRIIWADGLPQDDLEQSQIESARLVAGNTSLESAIRRLDGLDGKALQEEIERIKRDRQEAQGNIDFPNFDFSNIGKGEDEGET